MKVTLETRTETNPKPRCRVIVDEYWDNVDHFDKAMATIRTARAWLVKQQAEAK